MGVIMDSESDFLEYRIEVGLSICGFCSCENIVLWRGHFIGTGSETSVNLSINGGEGE